MNLDNIRIVLVNTSHPGNIGGAARAMKNMGLTRLTLVAPKQFPDEQAQWRAVSAADLLEQAVVVDTVEEAVADCQFVVGTSARNRSIPWPLLDPRRCAERIGAATRVGEQVAILFGREDRGLTNEELQLCNLHLNVPTSEFSSLNLAMAVQVVCYELRMLLVADDLPDDDSKQWDTPFSTAKNMELYYQHLEETLVDIGFLDPKAPRQLMSRLRRLFGRVRLDELELNILRGVLSASQKWARKAKKGNE